MKLSPKLQEELTDYIKTGSYIITACRAVGINKLTYYRWVQRGAKASYLKENGKEIPESEKIYYNFCNSVRKAQAIGELEILGEIRKQVKKDWHAGIEILARKYPQRWARRDKLEVKTKKTVESKQIIEFRTKEKELTVNTRKQLVEFTMKAIEEHTGSNGNNGNS